MYDTNNTSTSLWADILVFGLIILGVIIGCCFIPFPHQAQPAASTIISQKDALYSYVVNHYHSGVDLNTLVTSAIEKYSKSVPYTNLHGLYVTNATLKDGTLSFSYSCDLSHGFRNVVIDNPSTSNNNNNNVDTMRIISGF